jgi:DNA-binding FrmR family transcriptional regulator
MVQTETLLPDFDVMGQAHATLGVHYARMSKLPAFGQSNDILQQLAALQQTLQQFQAQMNTRFDRVDSRLEHLEGEVQSIRTAMRASCVALSSMSISIFFLLNDLFQGRTTARAT